ncbi:hypothetical protein HKCCE4037_06380 [Rhodobacterales bacterium HKCCE4037]|nr:hypothetical protein [Rhodobacterales bacterium HKCCE4037]
MAYLNDDVLDNGLQELTDDGTAVYICSQEPTTYAEATSTYALGAKTGITVGSPEDGAVNGRRVIVPPISDGGVTATGTATHQALVDVTGTRLLAVEELDASQAVTNGNSFSLTAWSITIPDPA